MKRLISILLILFVATIFAQDKQHLVGSLNSNFGEMYIADNSTETTISAGSTWYEVTTGATAGSLVNVTFSTNKLTVSEDGKYFITWSASTSAASINNIFRIGISVNDSAPANNTIIRRKYGNTDVGASAGSAVLDLSTDDYIKLEVYNETGTGNITVSWANIQLHRL